jgi:hypothetical protein
MRRFLFAFLVGVSTLSAGVVVVTDPSALQTTDYALWSKFGPDQTQVGQYGTVSSTLGDYNVNVALLNPGSLTVLSAGTDWAAKGGIQAGDALVSTNDGTEAGGPMRLMIPNAVFGGGAYIQGGGTGQFVAHIQAFAGFNSVLDATLSSDASGDPLFLGAYDTNAEITKIIYSLTSAADGQTGNFVLDKFYLQTTSLVVNQPPPPQGPALPQVGGVPEPAFTPVVAFALAAFGLGLKKRLARKLNR